MTTAFTPQQVDEGDYCQVAENSWDSYTQTIKDIAAARGMDVATDRGLLRAACELNALAAGGDSGIYRRLRTGFHAARSLHRYCYENDLPDGDVTRSADEVRDAIDLLQRLL